MEASNMAKSHTELPLFREAALPAGAGHRSGVPIGVTPVPWRILTGFLLVVFASALLFLSTQSIVRRENAKGVLALSLGEIRIVPPRPGVVTNLYVTEGQQVVAGQRIAYVSTAQHFIDGGGLEGELLGAIADERTALIEQLHAQEQSAPTELKGQRESLAAKKRKFDELLELLPSLERRLTLAERAHELGKSFHDQGALSGDALRQREYELLNQRSEMQTTRAQIVELQGAIAHDEAELTQLPQQQTKLRAELSSRLASLQQKELSTTGQEGYLIVSRVTGRVTALQARLGQHVDSSRPLMAITPQGSWLQAELYVPSKAIAFAKAGQRVRLLYDAFPYQQFGSSLGTVREISATVLRPDEIGAPIKLEEPAYRVLVVPDKAFVRAYGVNVPLRSGMALSADLVLEERSFLRLLLDPLLAARGRILAGE
jgi:membrane fusion protein